MVMTHVEWQDKSVGLVWSADGTMFGPSLEGSPLNLIDTYDLGSKYTFAPLSTAWEPCGEEIGGYLQNLISKHSAPLFIKMDNGSNLNSDAVKDVLRENWVITLNSPVRYPMYNGSLENNNRLLKKAILNQLAPYDTCSIECFGLHSKLAAHDLNHKPREVLKGKIPCSAYYDNKEINKFDIRERRGIYDWITNVAKSILAQLGTRGQTAEDTAWRKAIESWLVLNGFVKTKVNGLSVNLFPE